MSEWGVADLQAAVEKIASEDDGALAEAFKKHFGVWAQRFEPYQWWDEAGAAGVPLPSTTHVWHYHPVAFMQQLFEDGYGRSEPTFFVERNGEEVEIERPDDSTAEEDQVAVYVRESDGDTWQFGKTQDYSRYRGFYRTGNPDLYEMLIAPADTEGIPDLSDIDKRVWASLREIEGGIRAINTYDAAFLSAGPLQQTVGVRNWKGELQGALQHVKEENSALYERLFGQYGLEVTGVTSQSGVDKGHFILNGEPASSAESKEQFRDLIWSWRFYAALENLDFRQVFLEHGFDRLETIRNFEATLDIEVDGDSSDVVVEIGDVYQTDLAQALLLGAHINWPAAVYATRSTTGKRNIWADEVEAMLEAKGTTDISELTQNDEYKLIEKLIRGRNASSMTNPQGRASKIMACLDENTLKQLAQASGYDNAKGFCATLGLSYAKISGGECKVLDAER